MIVNSHPILHEMELAPFKFHLIGSRFVGVFSEKSDFDFIAELSDGREWEKLHAWMVKLGFKPSCPGGYGPDGRLFGGDVWTCSASETAQAVDILPMSNKEAAMRLRWFNAMKAKGQSAGLIAKGLKQEKAWPLLWATLARFDGQ